MERLGSVPISSSIFGDGRLGGTVGLGLVDQLIFGKGRLGTVELADLFGSVGLVPLEQLSWLIFDKGRFGTDELLDF